MVPGKTKLVMLESPTNPRMNICDIAGLTAIAHEVHPHPHPCTPKRLILAHASPMMPASFCANVAFNAT